MMCRLVLVLAFVLGCGGASLPAGIHELAGLDEKLPFDDLRPLQRVIGNAEFVGLGESTHTSNGYYQAKFRLFRYLVEELGFRALAFETAWLEAAPASAYVATCAGTPEQGAKSFYPVWHDRSIADLLQWMCSYNQAHPADPLTFFGFDIQEPWTSQPAVQSFFETVTPAEAASLSDPMRSCLGVGYSGSYAFYSSQEFADLRSRPVSKHDTCIGGIAVAEDWIAQHPSAASAAELERARLSLLSLRAYENQLWIPDPGGYEARDSGMAAMILRLRTLLAPGKKTAIWAWNFHLALDYPQMHGFNDDPSAPVGRQGGRAMGTFLRDAVGAAYVPIGLVGYRVESTVGTPPPVPALPASVEKRLHDLGKAHLLVDLTSGPVGNGLIVPGADVQFSQEWGDPFRQFKALLFLDHSPPMVPLG